MSYRVIDFHGGRIIRKHLGRSCRPCGSRHHQIRTRQERKPKSNFWVDKTAERWAPLQASIIQRRGYLVGNSAIEVLCSRCITIMAGSLRSIA
jgi:hypothetical protein